MSRLEIVHTLARLQCTRCGAEANASCNCGEPYVPAAIRVQEYDKANPGKSTRAAAAELGISKSEVGRARQSVVPSGTPGTVTGRDGKTYKAKAEGKARPDFEALQAHAQERGWHLGRDGKGFNLYRDIQNPELWCGDHVSVIPVALRDVLETLDDIERNPGKYRDITHPQPAPEKPKATAAPESKATAAPPPITESAPSITESDGGVSDFEALKKQVADLAQQLERLTPKQAREIESLVDPLSGIVFSIINADDKRKRLTKEAKNPQKALDDARKHERHYEIDDARNEAKREARECGDSWSDVKDDWEADWLKDNWDEKREQEFLDEFKDQWKRDHGHEYPGSDFAPTNGGGK